MEDTSRKPKRCRIFSGLDGCFLNEDDKYHGFNDEDAGECSSEAWKTLCKGFKDVQLILDQNRALIQQVNENHQSMIPENLVKNVSLLQKINSNIARITSLYSDMSADFASNVHQNHEMNEVKSSES